MEGVIFYWILWGLWIVATFVFKKGLLRYWISLGCLGVIIGSGLSFQIGRFEVNCAFIILFAVGIGLHWGKPFFECAYQVLASFIFMLLNMLYHIYIMYDPAVLLVVPHWLFLTIIFVVLQMFVVSFRSRLSVLLSGACLGEWLLTVIFNPYDRVIGDSQMLDNIAFFLVLALGWQTLIWMSQYLKKIVNKPFQTKIKSQR